MANFKKKASCGIISELKKSGMPFEIVRIERNPEAEKETHDYVMQLEEAHKKAARSKLHFKNSETS